ncbi:MAG: hypothetical protein IJU16_08480 [Clostridia bacterium]|nr:hypothetical protein [Clostridia bacterium]
MNKEERRDLLPNTEQDKLFRRRCDTLAVAGMGVIAFGVWSVLKTALFCVLGREAFADTLQELAEYPGAIVAVFGVIALIVLIDLALRLVIGLSARRESRGQNVGVGYLVLVGWFLTVETPMLVVSILSADGLLDGIIAGVVQVTEMVLLIELWASAIYVRRQKKAG